MKNVDVELIQRVLNGDDTAFSALVKKYKRSVHALAWREIGDFHIAEDITQETFLKAYQRLSTLKEPQSFAGWLYVIARNRCKAWLRKKRLWTQSLENTNSSKLEGATYSSYVIEEKERAVAEVQREVVKKLLAKLKESDRTVITLYYLGGMTYEEISGFLGVSVSSIKNRLYRARQHLKKEEPMIKEALENFRISPNLTDNIMREISRIKPAPSGGKPLVPWVIAASSAILIVLMLGISNQYLVHFQKPYNLDAQAEIMVELVDAPIVRNLEAKPDDRNQLGSANAPQKNSGVGQQTDDLASLDLDTIIAKIKHYDSSVISLTGDFVRARHKGPVIQRQEDTGIRGNEYRLTFEGEKIQVEQQQQGGMPLVVYWDGARSWEGNEARRIIFDFEMAPGKEKTDLEMIQQAFKQQGIDLADDVRIVDDDEPQGFILIENETDRKYYFWLEGETTLLVYDYHLEYGVRPQWMIFSDNDPRYWLTFARLVSNNSYMTEPLWQLLEKHESEIIGSEVLNGEKTSVIRLNIPAWSKEDFKVPAESYKIWISQDKGFRMVKSEKTFTVENPTEWSSYKAGVTYITTRKIEYHEYLPDVWFPKRIESSTAPKASPEPQQDGEDLISKDVLLTKQCQLNTDVIELLSQRLPPNTPIFDYGVGRPSTVGNVLNPKPKPDTWTLLENSTPSGRNDGSDQQTYNPAPFDLATIIAKIRQYDDSVISVSGDFVIEHHRESGIAKTKYALTFEGEKIRVQREWVTSLAAKDYPLVERILPRMELYDGERRWDIYKYKKLLFSVEVARDKERTVLQIIQQTFKQQGIDLADDVRIAAGEKPDNFTLSENGTDKTYSVSWSGETTLKVYELQHLEYAARDHLEPYDRRLHNPVRHQWGMFSELDPRNWLTYPSAGGSTYLTEPLWQLLEKHECQLLGSEVLNGEETSVVRINLPDQALKLWISHEKGFRLVKLERAFFIENPTGAVELMYFESGITTYVATREIEYHEYLPDVWFPKKIEQYYMQIAVEDPQRKKGIPLKTVILTKQCRLNTNVAELLNLNLSPNTPIFGLRTEIDAPVNEKVAYLRQEIFRVLERRLDFQKLSRELAEFYGQDPELSLLRDKAYEESSKLLPVGSQLISQYMSFSKDSSVVKPGGLFYDLMEQNGFSIQVNP